MTEDQLSLDEELDTWHDWFQRTLDPDLNPQLRPKDEDPPRGGSPRVAG